MSRTDVAIVIPSRERAIQAARLVDRLAVTCTTRAKAVVVVDEDDSDLEDYARLIPGIVSMRPDGDGLQSARVTTSNFLDVIRGHVPAVNTGAAYALARWYPSLIVKLDDDHWPLTQGWDADYLRAAVGSRTGELGGCGLVYGDDGYQGERLPTAVGITANLIKAWGFYAPPELTHLYCDNFWKAIGQEAGCLAYLPGVKVEHRHPAVGKAPMDNTYAEGGQNDDLLRADHAAWERWRQTTEYQSVLEATRDVQARARGGHLDAAGYVTPGESEL